MTAKLVLVALLGLALWPASAAANPSIVGQPDGVWELNQAGSVTFTVKNTSSPGASDHIDNVEFQLETQSDSILTPIQVSGPGAGTPTCGLISGAPYHGYCTGLNVPVGSTVTITFDTTPHPYPLDRKIDVQPFANNPFAAGSSITLEGQSGTGGTGGGSRYDLRARILGANRLRFPGDWVDAPVTALEGNLAKSGYFEAVDVENLGSAASPATVMAFQSISEFGRMQNYRAYPSEDASEILEVSRSDGQPTKCQYAIRPYTGEGGFSTARVMCPVGPLAPGGKVSFGLVIAPRLGSPPIGVDISSLDKQHNRAEVGLPCSSTQEIDCNNNVSELTVTRIEESRPMTRVRGGTSARIAGTAAPVISFGPRSAPALPPIGRVITRRFVRLARVEVAVRRLGRARSSARRARCTWLASRSSARFVTRSCAALPVWLRAAGTKTWVLRFRRHLPAGRYVAYARAVDKAGVATTRFTARARDLLRLTVR